MPHVPEMEDLTSALIAVGRLPISARARRELQKILAEASLPDRHDPSRLEPDHAENIRTHLERLTEHTLSVVERGQKALMAMSAEEWDRLVKDANRE